MRKTIENSSSMNVEISLSQELELQSHLDRVVKFVERSLQNASLVIAA